MSRAIGWTLVILLVVLLGTHPSALAGLVHGAFVMLQRAGDELSTFVGKL